MNPVGKLVIFDELKISLERYLHTTTPIRLKTHLHTLNTQQFSYFPGGRALILHFQGFPNALKQVYPYFRLTPSDIGVYRNFWSDESNARMSLENPSCGGHRVQVHLDWLLLRDQWRGYFGAEPKDAPMATLQRMFPQFFWDKTWRFPTSSCFARKRVYLDDLVLNCFDFVERKHNLLGIDVKSLLSHPHGNTIIRAHDNSYHHVFDEMYPELELFYGILDEQPGKMKVSVDRFVVEVGFITSKPDFVGIKKDHLTEYPGGATFLSRHNGSLMSIFNEFYPELVLSYSRNRGYWRKLEENLTIHQAMRFYRISKKDDWYKVSVNQMSLIYSKKVTKKNMTDSLNYWFPEESWDILRFSEKINKKSTQRFLGLRLMELFKNEVIFEDYKFYYMDQLFVFDFYFPGLNLVVEYQGEQHYFTILKWLSLHDQKKKDMDKIRACTDNGLQLIYVPYWWDGSAQGLRNILK